MFNNKIKREVNKLRSEMNILIHQVRVETQQALNAIGEEIRVIKKLVGEDKKSFGCESEVMRGLLCLHTNKTPKDPSIIERLDKMEDFLGVVYTVDKKISKGYTKIKNNKKNK